MKRIGRIALECPDLDERGFFEVWNYNARPYWYLKLAEQKVAGEKDGKNKFTKELAQYVISTGVRVEPDAPKPGWIIGRDGERWRGKWFSGTWMATYISAGLWQYWNLTGDEDARDLIIAFSRFAERYLFYPPCGYIPYTVHLDFPLKDDVIYVEGPTFWTEEHCRGKRGSGKHQGWHTWHYVDTLARGYLLSGETDLLEMARTLWSNGSKRGWYTKILASENEAYRFVSSNPWNAKEDQVSSCSLLFWEAAHPRKDPKPPEPVTDLQVRTHGAETVEVWFTAPADCGGGQVSEYQVKYAELPLADYREWSFRNDGAKKCNWWRAINVQGEPDPLASGREVRFVLHGVPHGNWYFGLRSFDDSSNRSKMSNLVQVEVD
jgi:hypothetical protein